MQNFTSNSFTSKALIKYGFALTILSTIVFFIDFFVYIFIGGINEIMTFKSWLFYIIETLGYAFVISLVIYAIFYVPIALITKKKSVATGFFITVFTLVQIFLILNGLVFKLYKFHINGFIIDMIMSPAASEVFAIDSTTYFYVFLYLIGLALLPSVAIVLLSNKTWRCIYPSLLNLCLYFSCVVLLCVVLLLVF